MNQYISEVGICRIFFGFFVIAKVNGAFGDERRPAEEGRSSPGDECSSLRRRRLDDETRRKLAAGDGQRAGGLDEDLGTTRGAAGCVRRAGPQGKARADLPETKHDPAPHPG